MDYVVFENDKMVLVESTPDINKDKVAEALKAYAEKINRKGDK